MNRFYCRSFVFIMVLVFLAGCDYQPVSVLPDHVKTVAIETFSNKTAYYGIEEKLTHAIVEEFLREGRLGVAKKEEADSLLSGKIVRYTLEPLSYDENDIVEEYRLWIVVDITFKDLKEDQILWEQKGIGPRGEEQGVKRYVRYYVTPKAGQMVETEEDALERLIDKLANDIVRLIVKWQ